MAATPRIRPDMMASFSGRKEAPVRATQHIVDVFVEKPGSNLLDIRDLCHAIIAILKLSWRPSKISFAIVMALCSFELYMSCALNLYFCDVGDDLGLEVFQPAPTAPASRICTSTTMASTCTGQ